MTLDTRQSHYSIADYLSHERLSPDKHEYRNGEILPKPGGSPDHSLVTANIIGELGNVLKGKGKFLFWRISTCPRRMI